MAPWDAGARKNMPPSDWRAAPCLHFLGRKPGWICQNSNTHAAPSRVELRTRNFVRFASTPASRSRGKFQDLLSLQESDHDPVLSPIDIETTDGNTACPLCRVMVSHGARPFVRNLEQVLFPFSLNLSFLMEKIGEGMGKPAPCWVPTPEKMLWVQKACAPWSPAARPNRKYIIYPGTYTHPKGPRHKTYVKHMWDIPDWQAKCLWETYVIHMWSICAAYVNLCRTHAKHMRKIIQLVLRLGCVIFILYFCKCLRAYVIFMLAENTWPYFVSPRKKGLLLDQT